MARLGGVDEDRPEVLVAHGHEPASGSALVRWRTVPRDRSAVLEEHVEARRRLALQLEPPDDPGRHGEANVDDHQTARAVRDVGVREADLDVMGVDHRDRRDALHRGGVAHVEDLQASDPVGDVEVAPREREAAGRHGHVEVQAPRRARIADVDRVHAALALRLACPWSRSVRLDVDGVGQDELRERRPEERVLAVVGEDLHTPAVRGEGELAAEAEVPTPSPRSPRPGGTRRRTARSASSVELVVDHRHPGQTVRRHEELRRDSRAVLRVDRAHGREAGQVRRQTSSSSPA